jgi:hypothetical protein
MHPRPLLVDHGPDVRTDGTAHALAVRLRKCSAVPHDRREGIRLAAHPALSVAVVLVGDVASEAPCVAPSPACYTSTLDDTQAWRYSRSVPQPLPRFQADEERAADAAKIKRLLAELGQDDVPPPTASGFVAPCTCDLPRLVWQHTL